MSLWASVDATLQHALNMYVKIDNKQLQAEALN